MKTAVFLLFVSKVFSLNNFHVFNVASKTIGKKSKNRKEKKTKKTNEKGDVEKLKRISPNHFVSIQVTNQEVKKTDESFDYYF